MIGQIISHYRILEKLGEGGMGIVYKAEDLRLKKTVALKFLKQEALGSEEEKTRFLHEAQASAALDHPSICPTYDVDQVEGPAGTGKPHGGKHTFIVMAYIEGESLKQKIAPRPLPLNDVLDIAIQIAEGLHESHEKGIVHRDIKSANIMISARGQAKIMDFGLAQLSGRTKVTQPGMTVGTVSYMSPEQTRGENVDVRTDIWSLGIMLYEMVTGKLPFRGDYDQAVVYQILNEEQEPITSLRSNVPMDLERIVNKALVKKADERYQHMDEMLIDLRTVRKEIESTTMESRVTRVAPPGSRRAYLYGGLAVLFIVLIGGGLYLWQSAGQETVIDSIAVLPLENLSHDPEQEYFSDGMTEALIAELAQIGAVRVISRTSVMMYKGVRKPLPDIARELRVDAVVEGSVLRSDNRVRITAQLIGAVPERTLWVQSYDRDIRDVLVLHREVARAIANEIKVKLTPEEQARLTSVRSINPEAYQFYLMGRFYWNKRTGENFRKAIQYFENSITSDPTYALAYAGLADSYALLGSAGYGGLSPRDAFLRAKAFAGKALELDERLGEAHTSLAFSFLYYDWDWMSAEREFKRAIELNPGYATAHQWHALNLAVLGQLDESITEIKRAQELDPLSLIINVRLGTHLYWARRYDEAVRQYRKVLELDPGFGKALLGLGSAYVQKEMYREAMTELSSAVNVSGRNPETVAALAHACAVSGDREEAEKMLNELKASAKQKYVSAMDIAIIYVGLGEKNQAFEWLGKACEERYGDIVFIDVNPLFDSLRSDPRFTALLKKIGLRK